MDGELRFVSLADDPALLPAVEAIERDVPPFLGELTRRHRDEHARTDPGGTWVVHEGELPVAAVRAVRITWDGTSSGAPEGGVGEAARRAGEAGADTLAVLDVTVAFGARGRGIGAAVLRALDDHRAAAGLARLLVLLRPHAKTSYPLVPFARYASFTRTDGTPFDPWFRCAWRAGLVPVRAAERSLSARADLAAWQRWLDVDVPGSGPYLVDGAIKPAIVEVERDEGRYREPHLWVGRDVTDVPADGGWVAALGHAGVVAGDRSHREPRRPR
jgi:GNAT superfamily N-acetyltransferase